MKNLPSAALAAISTVVDRVRSKRLSPRRGCSDGHGLDALALPTASVRAGHAAVASSKPGGTDADPLDRADSAREERGSTLRRGSLAIVWACRRLLLITRLSAVEMGWRWERGGSVSFAFSPCCLAPSPSGQSRAEQGGAGESRAEQTKEKRRYPPPPPPPPPTT